MPTEWDATKKIFEDQKVEDLTNPFVDTCCCGAISLRKGTIILAAIDIIVSCFALEYDIKTRIRHHGYQTFTIKEFIYPLLPIMAGVIVSVFGFYGAIVRMERLVRIYSHGVLFWPMVFCCLACLFECDFVHVGIPFAYFTYGLWKHQIARNCSLAYCVGYSGDEGFTRHSLLRAAKDEVSRLDAISRAESGARSVRTTPRSTFWSARNPNGANVSGVNFFVATQPPEDRTLHTCNNLQSPILRPQPNPTINSDDDEVMTALPMIDFNRPPEALTERRDF